MPGRQPSSKQGGSEYPWLNGLWFDSTHRPNKNGELKWKSQSIDEGEGADAVKISVAVRSLDTKTHSTLTQSDRAAITKVLTRTATELEAIIASGGKA